MLVVQSFTVTVRGQTPKRVDCASVQPVDEFVAFLDDAGAPVLFVRRDELVSVERYEEPPF